MPSLEKKKVSQEYFDQIVSENVNEFEMTQSEAIEDAVSQLKSQNVDISLICTFAREERDELTSAIERLDKLLSALNKSNKEEKKAKFIEATPFLSTIKEKCVKNISFRCLATNAKPSNFYEIVMSFLKSNMLESENKGEEEEEMEFNQVVLRTFDAYLAKQSDAVKSEGLCTLIDLTTSPVCDRSSATLQWVLKCIDSACQTNEPNRQFLVENGLCEKLIELIKLHKTNSPVLSQVCQLIRSLLLDDDFRCEFGKSHSHAKFIASELNGIDVLISISMDEKSAVNDETVGNIMLTLSKLAVRNEYCQEIYDKGGLKFIMKSLDNLESLKENNNARLIKSSLSLLKSICNNDQVKHEATKMQAIKLLHNVVLKTMTSELVVRDAAVSALATLLLRNDEAVENFFACDCHKTLVQLLAIRPARKNLVKETCRALRNSISRRKEFQTKLIDEKIETILKEYVNDESLGCQEQAKTVLRDLGCEVHLKELWAGSGKDLIHD